MCIECPDRDPNSRRDRTLAIIKWGVCICVFIYKDGPVSPKCVSSRKPITTPLTRATHEPIGPEGCTCSIFPWIPHALWYVDVPQANIVK